MIKVRINKASNKCGGSTELVVMTEGGNVFAGQTADIPIDYIEPTLNAYYDELERLFPERSPEISTLLLMFEHCSPMEK
mgnify:CR=1 FL=1